MGFFVFAHITTRKGGFHSRPLCSCSVSCRAPCNFIAVCLSRGIVGLIFVSWNAMEYFSVKDTGLVIFFFSKNLLTLSYLCSGFLGIQAPWSIQEKCFPCFNVHSFASVGYVYRAWTKPSDEWHIRTGLTPINSDTLTQLFFRFIFFSVPQLDFTRYSAPWYLQQGLFQWIFVSVNLAFVEAWCSGVTSDGSIT